ncbi:MAG: hypothetical protein IKN12_08315 [Selenomonadaceae bacterium]|nr:hypothetical protein [Selenomonadaceae bacterium]MBR3722757.1 hypothetical protein [Selenomonadaceae bacterium]
MLVRTKIDLSKPLVLTDEEERQLEELTNYPIVFDEDCPPLSVERMREHLIGILKKKETEIVVG